MESDLDLSAEREASRARREAERDELMLNARARNCRTALAERSRNGEGRIPKTLAEAARMLYPQLDDAQVARIVERAQEPQQGVRHVTPITTNQVREIARAYLQEHRTATGREAYQHVLRQGQPTISEGSFATLVMTPLRKELGITKAERPTGGTAAKRKAGGARKRPAETAPPPRPKPEAPEQAGPAPVPARRHETPAPELGEIATANGRFQDGDRILIEKGGERLEARREDGRWSLEFDGRADDGLVARIMGAMVAGVAG